jgi:hypothetical protein
MPSQAETCEALTSARHPSTNKRNDRRSSKMRQSSSNTRVLVGDHAIDAPINSQKRRHGSHSPKIPALEEDAGYNAERQIASAYALHESSCECIVLGRHAEQCCHGRGTQEGEKPGAQEEAGDAIVCE